MAGIGFFYVEEASARQSIPPSIQVVYFAKTTNGRDVHGVGEPGLKDVLSTLAFDDLAEYIKTAFLEMQELIGQAFLNGLSAISVVVEIRLDLFQGWEIHTGGLRRDTGLPFPSIKAFESFMVETWEIAPLRRESEADARASTIPGL
jgi:hypothetical protein